MKKSEREFFKKVKEHIDNIDLIEALSKEMDPYIRNWIRKNPEDWDRIKTKNSNIR
ncbi:MAG: hypothetical protein WCP32_08465 [Bacteroidota bacterium]